MDASTSSSLALQAASAADLCPLCFGLLLQLSGRKQVLMNRVHQLRQCLGIPEGSAMQQQQQEEEEGLHCALGLLLPAEPGSNDSIVTAPDAVCSDQAAAAFLAAAKSATAAQGFRHQQQQRQQQRSIVQLLAAPDLAEDSGASDEILEEQRLGASASVLASPSAGASVVSVLEASGAGAEAGAAQQVDDKRVESVSHRVLRPRQLVPVLTGGSGCSQAAAEDDYEDYSDDFAGTSAAISGLAVPAAAGPPGGLQSQQQLVALNHSRDASRSADSLLQQQDEVAVLQQLVAREYEKLKLREQQAALQTLLQKLQQGQPVLPMPADLLSSTNMQTPVHAAAAAVDPKTAAVACQKADVSRETSPVSDSDAAQSAGVFSVDDELPATSVTAVEGAAAAAADLSLEVVEEEELHPLTASEGSLPDEGGLELCSSTVVVDRNTMAAAAAAAAAVGGTAAAGTGVAFVEEKAAAQDLELSQPPVELSEELTADAGLGEAALVNQHQQQYREGEVVLRQQEQQPVHDGSCCKKREATNAVGQQQS